MSKTITLYTRQVDKVWKELQKQGEYTVKKEYILEKNDSIADYYLDLYQWYTKEGRKHIEIDKNLEYPIWLSLDKASMLQQTEGTIILKLEIPREEVLLCNNEAWGYRVNYWYIPLDKEDEKRHNEELKRYGISCEADIISGDKGNFYPLLKRKILNSWERVFTLKPDKESDYVATVWKIKKEWVKGQEP